MKTNLLTILVVLQLNWIISANKCELTFGINLRYSLVNMLSKVSGTEDQGRNFELVTHVHFCAPGDGQILEFGTVKAVCNAQAVITDNKKACKPSAIMGGSRHCVAPVTEKTFAISFNVVKILGEDCNKKFTHYFWPLQINEINGEIVQSPEQHIFLYKSDNAKLTFENVVLPIVFEETDLENKTYIEEVDSKGYVDVNSKHLGNLCAAVVEKS